MVNNNQIKEAGFKYKLESEKIRKHLMDIGKVKDKSLYDDDDEIPKVKESDDD